MPTGCFSWCQWWLQQLLGARVRTAAASSIVSRAPAWIPVLPEARGYADEGQVSSNRKELDQPQPTLLSPCCQLKLLEMAPQVLRNTCQDMSGFGSLFFGTSSCCHQGKLVLHLWEEWKEQPVFRAPLADPHPLTPKHFYFSKIPYLWKS